jgi:hypothetical protein
VEGKKKKGCRVSQALEERNDFLARFGALIYVVPVSSSRVGFLTAYGPDRSDGREYLSGGEE